MPPRKPKIGVAISTRNRREGFEETLTHWLGMAPRGTVIVVVDDASDIPVKVQSTRVQVIRNPARLGVAMTKNRGIQALMDAGVDHLFLADDDVWPVTQEWWRPYVESGYKHLHYGWEHRRAVPANTTGWPPRIVGGDDTHDAYTFPRGVLLYLTREVVDTVGGMNPAHGVFSGEHVEYSERIHAAGLTEHPYVDVKDSQSIWYARDREVGNTTGSSFELAERRVMHAANGVQYAQQFAGWPFMPYRVWEGNQDYGLGPNLVGGAHGKHRDPFLHTLQHVLGLRPEGVALEFGVGSGRSLRLIAEAMPVVGFDSFEGLPEKWRDGFEAGMFACEPPNVPGATIIAGLFEETLHQIDFDEPIGLVHIDCDLESSTTTVLEHIGPRLQPGAYVVFDEWHGFPGAAEDRHEQAAFRRYATETGLGWVVVGRGPEQWAIRITKGVER